MARKPSEILQLALDTGRYLNPEIGGEWYMCYLLASLVDEKVITSQEEVSTVPHIYGSFDGAFLIDALRKHGVISQETDVKDDEYKAIAYTHWENLIAKLKGDK